MNETVDHTALIKTDFEQEYLSLRKKEGRLYTDEQVRHLPRVAKDHPLWKEWRVREFSADNIFDFLQQKKRPLRILEVGCGSGWLSHKLSMIKNASVVGLDVNSTELEQAKRVFKSPQLQFVHGDLRNHFPDGRFDVIVFAASLQYFSSLNEVLNMAMEKLEPGGEIHVADTHFYKREELVQAAQRSKQYFYDMGFPLMDQFYFHHSLEGLDDFSFSTLYDPGSFINRILKQSPFCWILIKKC